MQEKRTHTRVPAKAIHETPANGVFITKNDLRNYGAFAGLFFLLLSAFAVLGRKCKKRKKEEKRQKRREMLRFRLAKPFPFRYTIRIV